MKKQTIVKDENRISIIPEYGRQRLLMYAESFRDLAEFFEKEEDPNRKKKRPREDLWNGRNICADADYRKIRSCLPGI